MVSKDNKDRFTTSINSSQENILKKFSSGYK